MKSSIKVLVVAAASAVMCSTLSNVSAQSLLAGYAVTSITSAQTSLTTFAATTTSPNVAVGPLTKGPGIVAITTTGVFGGQGWTNSGGTGASDTEAFSIASGHYLTYTVQANPGCTVSFSTNVLYWHNSATGPWNGELQYSADGINYTNIAFLPYTNGNFAATRNITNVLAGIPFLQNIPSTVTNFFRLVNWGATGSGGTWYVNNAAPTNMPDLQIDGAAIPVPPAENLATWWVNNIATLAGGAPPALFTNNSADPNLIVYPMMKGPGLGTPTGNAEYGGNAWTNAGYADTESNSILNGLYITYAMQAAPGYAVSFYTNMLWAHASSTGPHSGELQYSTDGSNYVDLVPLNYGVGTVSTLLTNTLTGFAFLQNIPSTVTNFFRIVNWGANSAAGTWYIFDGPPAGTPIGTNDLSMIGGMAFLNGVAAPTNVVVSPTSATNNAGQTVSFTVTASGGAASNLWYQIIGTPPTATTNFLAGVTSSTLTFPSVTGSNSGHYFVILTNTAGSATSQVVSLTVIDPIIQIEPSSAEGLLDGVVQFSVTAAGFSPSYQWYYSDGAGNILGPVLNGFTTPSTIALVSGATSSLLTVSNIQNADSVALTNLFVVVTNVYGSVTSSVASMSVNILNTPGILPAVNGVLTLWDFDGTQFTNTAVNPNSINNPVPFIGLGTASAVGSCIAPGTSPFSGSVDPNDVGYDPNANAYVFTPYGFQQPSPNFSWGTSSYPAATANSNKLNGAQFNVSTVGARNIRVAYESRVSATASEFERLQYTTNGTIWIDYPASSTFSGLASTSGNGWYPFNYSLIGFPGVDNNPNFGIRVVTEYQSTATYGIGTTNQFVGVANTYGTGGTVTYDLLAFIADAVTNANMPPMIGSFAGMPVVNGEGFTNMVDTNALVINFTASSPQMDPSQLTLNAQVVPSVAAGTVPPVFSPSILSVAHTSSTNFQLTVSFVGSPINGSLAADPILVTATDTNGLSAAAWFQLTVGSVNQPPTNTLTSIQSTNLLVNTPLTIPFIVGSARNPSSNFTFSVTSGNNNVIPAANVVFGGNTNTGNMTVTITPAPNAVGVGELSITVNDNDPNETRTTTANIAVIVTPNTNVVAVDYFNYDLGGSLDTEASGYWRHLSGVNGQLQVNAAPTGGYATISDGSTENLQAQLLNSPYTNKSGTVLYSSFTVAMHSGQLPTTNGSYFIAFNDGTGNTADVEDCLVAATNGAAPGYYRLGIANGVGATAANAQMFPMDLQPGVPYFVITSLVLSNGFSTLWVSPTNISSQSVRDTSSSSTTNIVNLELRESGSVEGILDVGSVLVGLSFNSVFYPAQASPDFVGVTENTTNLLNPLLNDAGWALNIISVTPDGNGATTSSGTNISFIPNSNFTGTSTISYEIQDNLGNLSTASILVTVTNKPPLAVPDAYTVLPNSVNNVLNPLTNDVLETPGGTLSLTGVSETDGNGTATPSGNQVLFTPTLNFAGTAIINYTVSDGLTGSSSSVITVTVFNPTPIPLNAMLVNNTNLVLSWTNALFNLQAATNVLGPYVTVPSAASPYTNLTTTNVATFFRLIH